LREALEADYNPTTPLQRELLEDIAWARHQVRRCRQFQSAEVERLTNRSRAGFDAEAKADAADLAERLRRHPVTVAARLRTSRPGVDYLIARWDGLGYSYDANGGWTAEQRAVAFDLLGIPHHEREDSDALPEHDDEALFAVI